MNPKDIQFLTLLEKHGHLNVNPERPYTQFPGSARRWPRQTLQRLRRRGYIRPTYHDQNCLVLTKWGQWRLDRVCFDERDDERTA